MSLPVTTHFGNPPVDANPQTITQLVALLNTLVSSSMAGTFTPYIMQFATPATDDQDKLWARLDGSGRLMGLFKYYSGAWRRQFTGRPSQMALFNGNPATYFDGTGLGIVSGEWDGWALANGANGTPNLSDRFLVIGKIDDSSGFNEGTGHWETHASGTNHPTGGTATITLTDATTYQIPRSEIVVGRESADGNAPNSGGGLYGSNISAGSINLQDADVGNLTPTAIPILPPYYAMAICLWVGLS